MKIFDELIQKTQALFAAMDGTVFAYAPQKAACEGEKNELVLRSEAAFELGEGSYDSTAFTLLTSDAALVPRDEIVVYGRELAQLCGDTPFARVTLLRTDDIEAAGEQAAYAIIKSIELKKHEVFPKGYMMRASALTNREQVRVAKTALKAGLSFEGVGNLFLQKYKESKHVLAAKIIFVTLSNGPYSELDALAAKAAALTKALNHILADMKMDCHACAWKPVCDEVDGLKEMHKNLVQENKIQEADE
ncbi:MAG: hypothetical protein RR215_00565 [Ruthenibacterium sp.]